jgi:hypothetical protein
MNAQRLSGRRPAAWVTAAILALVVSTLSVGPVAALPTTADEPVLSSICALWQRLSGWIGLAPERDQPPGTARAAGTSTAPKAGPGTSTQLEGSATTYRKSSGDDGAKLDPMG